MVSIEIEVYNSASTYGLPERIKREEVTPEQLKDAGFWIKLMAETVDAIERIN